MIVFTGLLMLSAMLSLAVIAMTVQTVVRSLSMWAILLGLQNGMLGLSYKNMIVIFFAGLIMLFAMLALVAVVATMVRTVVLSVLMCTMLLRLRHGFLGLPLRSPPYEDAMCSKFIFR